MWSPIRAVRTARCWSALVQAEAVGDGGGLDSAGDAQLGKDVGDVHADALLHLL
jgi:hypothetical protein